MEYLDDDSEKELYKFILKKIEIIIVLSRKLNNNRGHG